MTKSILKHKKNLLAFAVGLVAAALSSGVQQASASVDSDSLDVVYHSHGCIKMASSSGSIYVFSNGIKNTNTSSTLTMACALSSPSNGFEATDQGGADIYDNSNETTNGAGLLRSCFTVRATFGTGCSATASTTATGLGATGVGLVTLLKDLGNVDADAKAARYLEVTLPPQDVTAGSVLRGYGYNDVSLP